MRLPIQSLLLVLMASLASAQSLADVARKEAERRQTLSGNGKAYTNQDLKPVPQPPLSADDPDKDAAGAAVGDKDSGKEKDTDSSAAGDAARGDTPSADDGAKTATGGDSKAEGSKAEVRDQQYWSKRKAALLEQVERDQTYAAALQSRIDALTLDFVNRDDPAQRDQIAADRQRAVTELDRLRKSLEDQRRAMADFEEEARRSGVPPGWLR